MQQITRLALICNSLLLCNPATFENPCNPQSNAFKNNFTLKFLTNEKTPYCGQEQGLAISEAGNSAKEITFFSFSSPQVTADIIDITR